MLLVVFLLQTTIRAIVCANFFQKSLTIIKKGKWKRLFTIIYYSLIIFVITGILLLSLWSDLTINCQVRIFSKFVNSKQSDFRLSLVFDRHSGPRLIHSNYNISFIHRSLHEEVNAWVSHLFFNPFPRNEEHTKLENADYSTRSLLLYFCDSRFCNDEHW